VFTKNVRLGPEMYRKYYTNKKLKIREMILQDRKHRQKIMRTYDRHGAGLLQ
jgi:SpoVK/Ycf46/Vps4 family AAA+-type ATPase